MVNGKYSSPMDACWVRDYDHMMPRRTHDGKPHILPAPKGFLRGPDLGAAGPKGTFRGKRAEVRGGLMATSNIMAFWWVGVSPTNGRGEEW